MTQFGLFEGPENVKSKDKKIAEAADLKRELAEMLMPKPLALTDLRLKILRGFLSLHFPHDPEILLDWPLELLGGRTLRSLCLMDYAMARAWIQEYRLHPEEKPLLIQKLGEKAYVEQKRIRKRNHGSEA